MPGPGLGCHLPGSPVGRGRTVSGYFRLTGSVAVSGLGFTKPKNRGLLVLTLVRLSTNTYPRKSTSRHVIKNMTRAKYYMQRTF